MKHWDFSSFSAQKVGQVPIRFGLIACLLRVVKKKTRQKQLWLRWWRQRANCEYFVLKFCSFMVGLTSAWLAVEMLTRVRTSYILTGSEGGREGGREWGAMRWWLSGLLIHRVWPHNDIIMWETPGADGCLAWHRLEISRSDTSL